MNLMPTTDIFNVNNIESINISSSEFKDLIVKLAQNANKQNLAINSKKSGVLSSLEDLSGCVYENNGSFHKMISFGALPTASATKSVAHGITFATAYKMVKIYGAATNPTTQSMIPLPFAHPTAAQIISLQADATNVIVTTGATDYSAWTETFIFIEYLKY